ncbi:hypothetical protein EV193_11964 [Herbihabitans rhizosphaerae]|uniref:ANTAR domain-containing protein n=1 Tax=Herbihabitans rhizosphaerae TaxID=1872711 RepID=A0A4Q7KEK6_9PSEU|nr:hypothetical protein [Herbihabitans rhizosphaerae]RZS29660.1 hypothetical protein EV193_11964 [Herbihabitans rhizosphaerae]
MAQLDLAGIAEPHWSAAVAIMYAAQQGLLTAAQCDQLIDRLRMRSPQPQLSMVERHSGLGATS